MEIKAFEKAQIFIWNNARLIDRQLFAYLFSGGSTASVLKALLAYQNQDGGFGQALEPDKRAVDSQPIDAMEALHALDLCSALSDIQVHQQVLLPLCNWLESITTAEDGVPRSLPSANRYPHSPWWSSEPNPPASLNPTAGIAGLLLKSGFRHTWIERASRYCWEAIAASSSDAYHDLMPMITFLEQASDRTRAQAELNRIARRVQKPGVVEYDPKATGYVKMPLDWAPTPDSFCRPLFDDQTMASHLQALADGQQADGGWGISWETVSRGVEIEWRGRQTLLAVLTLRSYAA